MEERIVIQMRNPSVDMLKRSFNDHKLLSVASGATIAYSVPPEKSKQPYMTALHIERKKSWTAFYILA